jgi:hypothetical protein
MVRGYQPVIISLSEGLDIRLNHRCDVAWLVHVMHKTRYCIVNKLLAEGRNHKLLVDSH